MDSLGPSEQSGIEMYVALINQLCDVFVLKSLDRGLMQDHQIFMTSNKVVHSFMGGLTRKMWVGIARCTSMWLTSSLCGVQKLPHCRARKVRIIGSSPSSHGLSANISLACSCTSSLCSAWPYKFSYPNRGLQFFHGLLVAKVVEYETDAAFGFESAQTTPMVVMPYKGLSEVLTLLCIIRIRLNDRKRGAKSEC